MYKYIYWHKETDTLQLTIWAETKKLAEQIMRDKGLLKYFYFYERITPTYN